jgi:hypothetical protein
MFKFQIGAVNVSSSPFYVLGERIGVVWRAMLSRNTRQMSDLNAKLRYDIGEDDVRPQKDHGRGETSLNVMLRRSI